LRGIWSTVNDRHLRVRGRSFRGRGRGRRPGSRWGAPRGPPSRRVDGESLSWCGISHAGAHSGSAYLAA